MEASSTGAAVSAGVAVGDAVGLVCGVGEIVGEGFGDGDVRGPAGIVCCGDSDELSGSNGRLVMNSARNVASVAATMMLIAIQGSGFRGGRSRLRFAPVCGRREVLTTMRLFGDRGSGTWVFRSSEIISYTRLDSPSYQMRRV